MIPRVSRLGTGFVGAGKYYLHDKRRVDTEDQAQRPSAEEYMLHDKGGAQTSARLGFVELRNLPVRNPEPENQAACYEAAQKGLRCMAWLAAHAMDIRQASVAAAARAAGMTFEQYVSANNPFRGKKGQKPVYSLSIAWHPTKQRKPTRQEMVAAADQVLAVLGMADRQAVILQHKDTKHPHVHLIVNRVSYSTGLYAKMGNDWLRLSKWSLDYERRTGLILCTERMFNWEKRNAFREVKAQARRNDPNAKGRYVRGKSEPRPERDWWNAHEHLPAHEIRAARKKRQSAEATSLNVREARRVLLVDARLTRSRGRELGRVLGQLRALQESRRQSHRVPRGLLGQVVHLFRKTADAITGGPIRRRGTIERLRGSAEGLRQQIDDGKRQARADFAQAWARMEQRHAAERRRDEERIARRHSEERGNATADRARKQFNIRGDAETARYLRPAAPPLALTRAHTAVAGKAIAANIARETALARLAKNLGGGAIWRDTSRKESLVRPGTATALPKLDGRTPHQAHQREAKAPFERAAGQASRDNRPVAGKQPDYERAVQKELQQINAREEKRQRRRRRRPRGKSRRLS